MLILRRDAEQDIKDAYDWYEEQRQYLGHAFLAEVESTLANIEENPRLYAEMFENVRRALCKRFPFSVYFMESGASIVVIGVLHQRRRPSVWQSRK
jgi:plasmid stabilization system protein ParE